MSKGNGLKMKVIGIALTVIGALIVALASIFWARVQANEKAISQGVIVTTQKIEATAGEIGAVDQRVTTQLYDIQAKLVRIEVRGQADSAMLAEVRADVKIILGEIR